jgi:hypothetical protein
MAQEVARKIDIPEMTIVAGASHAGNLIPRIGAILEQGGLPLAHNVYINAGFERTNNDYFRRVNKKSVPRKYTNRNFNKHIRSAPGSQHLKIYNPRLLRDHFFNGCSDGDADWAAAALRPQYRPDQPIPAVPVWPNTESTYVIGTHDRVINPKYSRYTARAIGAGVIELETGHSGYISHPILYSSLLYDIAVKSLRQSA